MGSGRLLRLLLLLLRSICKHQYCLGCSRVDATRTLPRTVVAFREQCSRDGLPKRIPEILRQQQKQCGAGWPTLTVLRKEYLHCTRYVNTNAPSAVLVSTLREHPPRTVVALREQCSRNGLPKCIPETLREQQKQCGAGWPTLTVLSKEYRHCTSDEKRSA